MTMPAGWVPIKAEILAARTTIEWLGFHILLGTLTEEAAPLIHSFAARLEKAAKRKPRRTTFDLKAPRVEAQAFANMILDRQRYQVPRGVWRMREAARVAARRHPGPKYRSTPRMPMVLEGETDRTGQFHAGRKRKRARELRKFTSLLLEMGKEELP